MLIKTGVGNGLTSFAFTKRLQDRLGLSWDELLSYENAVCSEEKSWTYKRWFNLLKANNFLDSEIMELAEKRLRAVRENANNETLQPS